MTTLSIVIPVLGRNAAFEAGLVSVLSERPADCEVIAVLNGDYEDPYDLGDEVRFLNAPAGADWSQSVNRGVIAARSGLVHILDAGTSVTSGWTDAACARFRDARTCAVAAAVSHPAQPKKAIAGQVFAQGHVKPLPAARFKRPRGSTPFAPTAAAGFYRREDILALCGFAEGFPATLAVVDLAIRLHQAGGRVEFEPDACVTQQVPQRLSAFRGGQGEERFLLMQMEQISLGQILGRAALGLPGILWGAWGPLSGMARFAGRMLAWMEAGEIHKERRLRDGQTMELAAAIEERIRVSATNAPASRLRMAA